MKKVINRWHVVITGSDYRWTSETTPGAELTPLQVADALDDAAGWIRYFEKAGQQPKPRDVSHGR